MKSPEEKDEMSDMIYSKNQEIESLKSQLLAHQLSEGKMREALKKIKRMKNYEHGDNCCNAVDEILSTPPSSNVYEAVRLIRGNYPMVNSGILLKSLETFINAIEHPKEKP